MLANAQAKFIHMPLLIDRNESHDHFPRLITLFAAASIFCFWLGLRLPLATCCVARALAFTACETFSIGYLRWPGRANAALLRALRDLDVSLDMGFPSNGGSINLKRHDGGWIVGGNECERACQLIELFNLGD